MAFQPPAQITNGKVTKLDWIRVLCEYDMMRFPRVVGNPDQVIVGNADSFFDYVMANNGQNMCFTSHNAYSDFDFARPTELIMSNLFSDLDTDMGATEEEVDVDLQRATEFCLDNKIPFTVKMSGWNGYHWKPHVKPTIEKIDRHLSTKIKSVHRWFRDNIPLKSINMQCAEPKRMERIPFTRYVGTVDGLKIIRDTYCLPIPYEMVSCGLRLKELRELSKTPFVVNEPYRYEGDYMTLDKLIERFNIPIEEYERIKVGVDIPASEYLEVEGELAEFVKKFMPRKCIHNAILGRNPPHYARFAFCSQLRFLGFGLQEATNFFDSLSKVMDWNDRQNMTERHKQVYHIMTHQPPYSVPRCNSIKRHRYKGGKSLCIGEVCEHFKEENGNG